MGQKVHPIGFRLGSYKDWSSRWYAGKDYATFVHEDLKIRKYVKGRLYHAGIARIDIERASDKLKIIINTARPGLVIGRRGAEVDVMKEYLIKTTGRDVSLDIVEIRKPDLEAQLVAENVGMQLERRVSFRRAMKKAVTSSMRMGAKGIKIRCSGRLGGAEIARTEWYREGRVPLHTLKADIDYGLAEAKTTYGVIGIQVLIFKGELTAHPNAIKNEKIASTAKNEKVTKAK